jgi:mannose-1-phosphate guanylyltransferase
MAGGSGTRFWPGSRNLKPKQYLNMFGEESLIQATISRFSAFTGPSDIFIVSNKAQAQILEEQTTTLPRENLIYEPVGKNTLPCIGLAAMFAEKIDPQGVMVVSPADHLITNNKLFGETIEAATDFAIQQNGIVTIGITPTYPATGYGYVRVESEIDRFNDIKRFKVRKFVEKPCEKIAAEYIEQGGFYWNSGLFVFKINVFLDSVKQFAPALYNNLRKIQEDIGNPTFEHTLDSVYRTVENISVDYGIMEFADNIYLTEGNFEWNDLGSWESVYLASEKNDDGNVSKGETVLVDTKNSYISTDNGVVALIGVDDLIVVRNGNATLVCRRDKAESIKLIVDQLKERGLKEFL